MGILEGKIAIVTGASRGIGKGEALALAKEGAKVAVLAYLRGRPECRRHSEGGRGARRECATDECDVCQIDQINRSVDTVVAEWGTVDILVNNAQIIYDTHLLEDWTEEEMRATWESGLHGSGRSCSPPFPT